MVKHPQLMFRYMLCNKMNIMFIGIVVAALGACVYVSEDELFHHANVPRPSLTMVALFLASAYHFLLRRPSNNRVFLLDFAAYRPNASCLCSSETLLDRAKNDGFLSQDNFKLVTKILDRSGLGPMTYIPEALLEIPPKLTLDEARKETETVLFGAVDELLERTGVETKDIGILVVNCSLFNPTPSLSDTIVNHYKLRGNIMAYNLSGMGCSAGVLAVDFATQLLKAHPKCYALVLSTENGISSMYWGNQPSMLLVNCLFRMGGSAVLLSSHPSDLYRSKYELLHTLRTHVGADDNTYKCVFQEDDDDNKIGVSLSKELMNVARDALKVHITSLGPLVLPISEKLKFVRNLVKRKIFRMRVEGYIPNFKLAFKHFCIHTGGRAVLDRMQKSLELDDWHMEASRMTLYRFGNTSSSSIWYELSYCEAKGRIKRGDRIWQMAFGSGFKCNSAVWLALNNIHPINKNSPWRDEIDDYPVKLDPQVKISK